MSWRSNHLSIHQWARSAIHGSEQQTSPTIRFLSLKIHPTSFNSFEKFAVPALTMVMGMEIGHTCSLWLFMTFRDANDCEARGGDTSEDVGWGTGKLVSEMLIRRRHRNNKGNTCTYFFCPANIKCGNAANFRVLSISSCLPWLFSGERARKTKTWRKEAGASATNFTKPVSKTWSQRQNMSNPSKNRGHAQNQQ